MPYCSNCGQPTVPGAISCAACGHALPLPPVTYVSPEAPPPMAPAAPTMPAPALPRARPLGVSILAVLQWVGAGFLALYGVIFAALGPSIAQFAPDSQLQGTDLAGLWTFFVVMGLFMLAFAGLSVWIGIGLWRGRGWARITHLVLSWIGAVTTGITMVAVLVTLPPLAVVYLLFLAWYAFLIWYWMRPGVRAWFEPAVAAPASTQPTW